VVWALASLPPLRRALIGKATEGKTL
jgi:hypothetical protein